MRRPVLAVAGPAMLAWVLVAPQRGAAVEIEPLAGRIAHVRLTEGFWQVWLYDVASGGSQQVTFSARDKRFPAWGPSGTVLFRTNNDELYQIGEDGTGEASLLAPYWPAVDAMWSPGGARIVFSRLRTDIPDASNLWTGGGGDAPRMLTQEPGIQFNPAWSPDGERIVYSAGKGIRTFELFVQELNGGRPQQLTTNVHHEFFPAWSPDGGWIAYSSDASGDFEIWIMRADGSTPRQLTASPGLDSRPTWSPDGRWLAFTSNRRGRLEIWVMARDGGASRPLIAEAAEVCDPAWR